MRTIRFNGKEVTLAARRSKPRPRRLEPRAVVVAMRDAYVAGVTLLELGQTYGVTRERVRQLLKQHFGFTKQDGGHSVQIAKNAAAKAKNRKAWLAAAVPRYGCTRAELRAVPVRIRELYRDRLEYAKRMGRPVGYTLLEFYAARQELSHSQ